MSRSLTAMIAHAIKGADKRYFFEDYTAQAEAVLAALRRKGLTIVPIEPAEHQVEAAKDSLTYGRQRPNDMLQQVYTAMVKAAKP